MITIVILQPDVQDDEFEDYRKLQEEAVVSSRSVMNLPCPCLS